MSGIIQPLFARDAQGSLALTATNNITSTTTSYTFTAQNIGTASSDRYIIVAVLGASTTSMNISSVTIAGNAMTKESGNASNAFTVTGIYRLLVTTGTTADIVVNFNGSNQTCTIGVYSLTNFGTLSAPFNSATTAATTNPTSLSLNTRAGGAAIMITSKFQSGAAPTVSSYSGCDTQDYNAVNNVTNRTWIGHLNPTQVALSKTFSVTYSGGSTTSSTAVSY